MINVLPYFTVVTYLFSSLTCYSEINNASSFIIQGNEMHYDSENNTSTVIGDARAERDTDKGKQILTAESIKVVFLNNSLDPDEQKKSDDQSKSIKTIQANGKVVFKQKDLEMNAQSCQYESGNKQDLKNPERLKCFDNVKIVKNNQSLQGDEGEINLVTGQYTIKKTKSNSQAKAVIIPKSKL